MGYFYRPNAQLRFHHIEEFRGVGCLQNNHFITRMISLPLPGRELAHRTMRIDDIP